MEILARLNFDKLDHSKDNNPHLVVTLKAPTLDWVTKRPRLCILPIIDLSGSMRGAKLEYAKKSLVKLVEQLQIGDVAGLLAFESHVHVLVEPAAVTGELKTKILAAIQKMHTMGGTNYSAGMLKGLEMIQGLDLSPSFLQRIVMLTDGQPTEGVTDKKAILKMLRDRRTQTTVSAFGYGSADPRDDWNGCDPEFLSEFSREGAGNYAYVKDPDDVLSALGKELGGLLSTYATDLLVEIEPVHGHQITKVVTDMKINDVKVEVEQDVFTATDFRIPDIMSEEVRHFVFETIIKGQDKTPPRPVGVFNVKVTYSVLTESGTRETKTAETKARVEFVGPDEAQKEPHKEVDEIVGLHQIIRAQLTAEEQAKKGEFKAAAALMEDVSDDLSSRGYNNLAKSARNVRHRVSSQDAYASSSGYLRSFSAGGTRGYGASGMDVDAEADLIGCSVAMQNLAMDQMVSSFTEPSVVIDPALVVTPAIPAVPVEPAVVPGTKWTATNKSGK
jgi:Ca-activated chloride channel family protein